MFCTECGSQQNDESKYCSNCGARIKGLSTQTNEIPTPMLGTPETDDQTKQGPQGVAGWLMLLVLGMMLFGPIMSAGTITSDILLTEKQYPSIVSFPKWDTYKTVAWACFFLFSSISIYGGWGLAKAREASVVSRAKIILWVTGPLATIIMGVSVPSIIFGIDEFISPELVGQVIGSMIAVGIWTVYLAKSKRVRNTYNLSRPH